MFRSKSSLTDHVAGVLIDRILGGEYGLGTKMPSGRLLAREFGVSAAVIREATERLRTKGLVRSRQGAGCIVIANKLDEGFQLEPQGSEREALLHIYELRAGVEGAAAALAAQRATTKNLDEMAHILAQLKASLHVPESALEWDFAFHRSLAAATHNPHYPQLLAYLSAQWRHSVEVARKHTLEASTNDHPGLARAAQVHEEHEAIYDAVRARDPSAARRKAEEHLQQACERLGLGTVAFASSIKHSGTLG